jgi:hypothetical protein
LTGRKRRAPRGEARRERLAGEYGRPLVGLVAGDDCALRDDPTPLTDEPVDDDVDLDRRSRFVVRLYCRPGLRGAAGANSSCEQCEDCDNAGEHADA